MPIIDTHCHLYFPQFTNSYLKEVLERCEKVGVTHQIMIGCDEISSLAAIRIAQKYNFKTTLGLHPCDVSELGKASHRVDYPEFKDYKIQAENLDEFFIWLEKTYLENPNLVVGFGETGLDLFHQSSPELLALQLKSFEKHLDLSVKYQKTLIIHSRNAKAETLLFLEKNSEKIKSINTIWHCFCEDEETALFAESLNIKIGIGGVATYPKSESIRKAIKSVNIKSLVTETDAPFLVPYLARKKKNKICDASMIPEVIDLIADLKNIDRKICEDQLYKNGLDIFRLEK